MAFDKMDFSGAIQDFAIPLTVYPQPVSQDQKYANMRPVQSKTDPIKVNEPFIPSKVGGTLNAAKMQVVRDYGDGTVYQKVWYSEQNVGIGTIVVSDNDPEGIKYFVAGVTNWLDYSDVVIYVLQTEDSYQKKLGDNINGSN